MTLNAVLPVAVSAAAGVGASAIPSAMARLVARALARRVLVKLIVAISKDLGSVGRGRIGPGMGAQASPMPIGLSPAEAAIS